MNTELRLTDGATRTCPQCRDPLFFNSRHPVLTVGRALIETGSEIADRVRYVRAWVCRNRGCSYRELEGDSITPAAPLRIEPSADHALDRIRGEFREMPGMTLTLEQVQRLCGVDRATCTAVLEALVAEQFLSIRPDGCYLRFTDGQHVPPSRIARGVRFSSIHATSTRRAS